MKLSNMENLILSYAYYKIIDFEKLIALFGELEEKEMFGIDEFNAEEKILSGSFTRPYPKGHWNPMAKFSGARQVVGHVSAKDDTLKLETMTKSGLKEARSLIESVLEGAIIFEKEEFEDPVEKFRR